MIGSLYEPVYLAGVTAVSLYVGLRRVASPDYSRQESGSLWVIPLMICAVFAVWLGLRPVHPAFGDTMNYALEYRMMNPGEVHFDWNTEWLWKWMIYGCKTAGMSVNTFFLIVELIYVFTAFFATWRLLPKDPLLGTLFVMSSLMFYTFGVNGIRNGMACHIVMLAIVMLLDDRYVIGGLLCLAALGIHRSTMLPIAAALVSIFLVKDFRYAMGFWVFSIFVSLIAGGAVSNFFASLGFDDRMTQYTTIKDMSAFSRTGFRWDFLLYSSVPIVMGWYICVKRKIQDNWYNVICTTYCLCNAFWVMVIRSAYSNRFAYLSWFIYPIVIAYPLVNLPVWEDQDRKTGWILLAYAGFTVFMLKFIWG